ncbi:MAG TPA: MFS transporter [Anaerolineae bacterium]|nr:MFS transporter [Anaerolineae bacterium]HID84061.1 MFS transporter [Anaerolineales bacterium]HIQ09223.1 MFS transporter [Anaerolineaceae bacterium]
MRNYPPQFWLMFVGMLLATLGASMLWPYLLIYASERLNAPLAQVGSLFTINAVMGLLAALLAGPVVDTWGRKGVLVISLLGAGACIWRWGGPPPGGPLRSSWRCGGCSRLSIAWAATPCWPIWSPPSAAPKPTLCCAWPTTWAWLWARR